MDYTYQPHPLDLLDFEPTTRARSNTWPCRPAELETPTTSAVASSAVPNPYISPGGSSQDVNSGVGVNGQLGSLMLLQKKSTSRRNAWGNMSYADLITQAISSSPEKRLTLSQIYDWMVGNVGYFKDKGDSNSSAGWKNSIRHNLSLHNRFVRVQNEGTGKSSWWMLNPDAKPGKAARRRATSMETSKFEKKRGRIRKKIEAMRNGTTLLDTPSPGSSQGEGLDSSQQWEEQQLFPPQQPQQQQLSPCQQEFRARASSNASSCGRLSPILSTSANSDLHDNQVPPLSPWVESYYSNDRFSAEQLVGGLGAVKLEDRNSYYFPGPVANSPQQQEEATQLNEFFTRRPELDFNFVENLAPFDPCEVDQVLGNELDLINWEMQQQQHGASPQPQTQAPAGGNHTPHNLPPLLHPSPLLLPTTQQQLLNHQGYNGQVATTTSGSGRQWVH